MRELHPSDYIYKVVDEYVWTEGMVSPVLFAVAHSCNGLADYYEREYGDREVAEEYRRIARRIESLARQIRREANI